MIRILRHVCSSLVLGYVLLHSSTAAAQDRSALLASAQQLEISGDYQGAELAYREYLATQPEKSAESRHVRLKLPVLQEAAKYGAGPDVDLFLSALNARASSDIQGALSLLQGIPQQYPASSLIDDALYLTAYITMMDNFNFELAHNQLQSLRYSYPQSRYYDTALYSEAITQEQLGNRSLAITKLQELRDRHTSISLAGIAWPRDEYLARFWFGRSNDRIDYLQNHQKTASSIISLEPYGEQGYAWRAVVSVDSHDLTLLLNKSQVTAETRIVNGDGNELNTSDTTAFAGRVEGEPDSWVRITIAENNLRGMISVYGKKHQLVPKVSGGTLSDFNPLLLGDIDGNISNAPDHALYPPKSEDDFNNYMRNIKLSAAPAFEEGTVGLTALIGVVVDSKFNSYHGGRGAEEARAILNTTDGIFREQFGLALQIDTIIVIDNAEDDPMNLGSVTMEAMMRNFRDYRADSRDLGSDIAVATLFSGNKNSDAALGLAWIGSACRTDGFDVSVVSPYRLSDLLSTHEIGHSLGAQHDQDTACSDNSTHVMWPYLSNTTKRTFSSCSKESVNLVIANGNCFIDTLDIGIDLSVSETSAEVTVINHDNTRNTSGSTVTIDTNGVPNLTTVPPGCNAVDTTLTCVVGILGPTSSEHIELAFNTPLTDQDTVIATVKPIGFLDSEPDNNTLSADLHGNTVSLSGSNINSDLGTASGARPGGADPSASAAGALSLIDILLAAFLLFGACPITRVLSSGVRFRVRYFD